MAKQQWKGSTLLGPIPPVMVSLGTMEQSNIITIAWSGIINSDPPKTYVSVRPERYSYDILKEQRELVINLTTVPLAGAADYCGIRSGRDVDKFARMGLTKAPASKVACPLIEESPLSLECKVIDIIPLGTHDMFLCDIVAVDVDENLLDAKGKLHMEKANLCGYVHGAYYALGKRIGTFGYSHAKKKKRRK